jgi:diguanylate cyclase (GGDEF)-like protein
MMPAEPPSNLDIVNERYLLSQALLSATASMARCTEPDAVLRAMCDSFAAASEHIKLAWMRLGELSAEILHPEYAAGSAAVYAGGIQISRNPVRGECPAMDALECWETVSGDVPPQHCPVLEAIENWEAATGGFSPASGCVGKVGLCSVVALPVGQRGGELSGIVTLYSDLPGYFDRVGTEFFAAFIHLANASLEQCTLLRNLTHMASHDLLTGLMNRRGTQECMEHELARSVRKGRPLSILLFDIDRFKLVNDRLGHKEGDAVLKAVADAAHSMLRGEDYFGRWGGEEFICVLPDATREDAIALAERMRKNIAHTEVEASSGVLTVTASFGVSTFPHDGDSIDKLIAAADAALYHAKRAGRDRCVSAEVVQQDVYSIGNMLDSALAENRIVPAYQPIIDLATGKVVAEETLARMITPDGEVIEAARFVAAASQLQLLHRIDQAIVMQAFSHCVVGLQSGMNRLDHFINISADLLRHSELVDQLLEAARTHCSGCGGLIGDVKPMVIEITERELLADIDTARDMLMPFIDFGLRLALDDFGSGYSSYQYLADLPIDFLKIDGSLVKRINEPKVRAIVQGIQDTADALNITTLAEFVENAHTEAILKEIGVHWAQGYYYGKPTVIHPQGITIAPGCEWSKDGTSDNSGTG